MLSMAISCIKGPDKCTGTLISILIDRTNEMPLKPEANTLVSLTGIYADKWVGSRVEISEISNKDINNSFVAVINDESSINGNNTIRDAKIIRFKNDITTAITNAYKDSIIELDHSIIWKTVVTKLNKLSKSGFNKKICIIYSDLLENGTLNFYDPATRNTISNNPDAIKQEFLKMIPLDDFTGVDIHLMFYPSSYEENNLFMAIVKIYKDILEEHHATVFVESNIVIQ